jgi:hypothetical protein
LKDRAEGIVVLRAHRRQRRRHLAREDRAPLRGLHVHRLPLQRIPLLQGMQGDQAHSLGLLSWAL